MKVLVTGASGFVGRAVTRELAARAGFSVRAVTRSRAVEPAEAVEVVSVGDLSSRLDWSAALLDCDAVIHLAARVHMMRDTSADPLTEFRRANTEGTLALARQAADAGVRRFVFLSSIKVNGERTAPGQPYRASDIPGPNDPYAMSKHEAELGLREIASNGRMQFVTIRPPLVYGPGVGANFLSMMRWVRKGVPLPLGALDNRRSLVALGNLVDLIVTCVDRPAAGNQTLLVSDGEDLSTADLLRRIGRELQRPARLLPVPPPWLIFGAAVLGRSAVARRLCDSLQIDSRSTCELLDWRPPLCVDEGLRLTVRHFMAQHAA